MLSLGLLSTGEKASVIEVKRKDPGLKRQAGCLGQPKNQMAHRVESIGLREGKVVEMLRNEGRGPVIVLVDGVRLAISRQIAQKIFVQKQD